MRSRRWSISPFDAGHTSVASACCVATLQALTPPHSNPERDPEWQYHPHRISFLFCTFPNAFMTYLRFRWQECAWPWRCFWSKRTPKLRDLRCGDFYSHIMLEIVSANFLTMTDELHQGCPTANHKGKALHVRYLTAGCIIIRLLFRHFDINIL
jgi:hypothetical protein